MSTLSHIKQGKKIVVIELLINKGHQLIVFQNCIYDIALRLEFVR